MKIGVNTVLFKDFTLRETFAAISRAGYDGVEISAIQGMCEHLVLDNWAAQAQEILALSKQYNLALLSMEVTVLDEARLEKAFAAAKALGIPVINVGPGGKSGDEATLKESLATLKARSELAAKYGVTLCVKAHVGAAIYNTPTTLEAMKAIPLDSFGIDMDPSHIHRAGETPKESLKAVIARVKHIHIRDCKGLGPSPGEPGLQTCGRGDIDLFGYFKVLADAKYEGPVCLEVIGPSQSIEQAITIAAESMGFIRACLKNLSIR
ncbi:AP endonuclease, family 2 [Leadbettera azotonutricia ZAS-9]|uniref:AP endonuclease, family 2 n=2 Tax=Leadbettera azotonutricia TaxID=150829 RepID=F5Y953_LEAAZ|nr:AP endonuclease, family 2 [Leadbettera azotonutricia ZAS-9]